MSDLETFLADLSLADWIPTIRRRLAALHGGRLHGDAPTWLAALARLPVIRDVPVDLGADAIRIGRAEDLNSAQRQRLMAALGALRPWRKGPFEVFGEDLDSEWRSDWKWNRVKRAQVGLSGARILDVGAGNGYYALRMLGAGAAGVLGVDPGILPVLQFQALANFMRVPAWILPCTLEQTPAVAAFDRVFSMGVLGHRRDPLAHLQLLGERLRPTGHLVLETLVVPGPTGYILRPAGRYARMRNVWLLPSTNSLRQWLQQAGFTAIELVHEGVTSSAEQRTTSWMRFASLADALRPGDPSLTMEGYPAPRRALLTARKPGP